jgi:hypothetical protein
MSLVFGYDTENERYEAGMRAEAVETPPYFNIDPDRAMAETGGPAATARFAEIAAACARGREDLASRGLNPEGRRELRLFSTWEITKYLIGSICNEKVFTRFTEGMLNANAATWHQDWQLIDLLGCNPMRKIAISSKNIGAFQC